MSSSKLLVFLALLLGAPGCATPLEETTAPASPIETTGGRTARLPIDALRGGASTTAAHRTRSEFDARLASAVPDPATP